MSYDLIIEPGRADRQYWRDLWHYRELFYILAWRDIAVRYKQTVVGVLWALIQPLLTMIIMTVIFGRVAKLPAPCSQLHAHSGKRRWRNNSGSKISKSGLAGPL